MARPSRARHPPGVVDVGLGDIASGLIGGSSDDGEESAEGDGEMDGDLAGDEEFGDLGGWDDEDDGMDDFGESDGGGASQLEPRLDELEKEMESISSTMGTVRSENEAINETVEDIEDNIRKLLEIYEMVTRGVNPFVDDAEGAAGMGDTFGLFDDGGGDGDAGADLDADVAEADADSFFDDDWDDDEMAEDEAEPPIADDEGVVADAEEGEEEGKTFDELKSEYEDGAADWNEGDEESEDEAEPPVADDEDASKEEPVPNQEVEAEAEDERASESSGGGEESADGKPYLPRLPTGYGADLLVIEWLSFLRSCSSTPEAFRAIRYYETIGWLGPEAAESLTQYLSGLGDGDPGPMTDGRTQLTVDHHTQSLAFIGKLGGTDVHVEQLDWAGTPGPGVKQERGKQRGLQR